MNTDTMNKITKIIWIILAVEIICIILSYLIDWKTVNNNFTSIAMMCCCFVTGLIAGKTLTENERS